MRAGPLLLVLLPLAGCALEAPAPVVDPLVETLGRCASWTETRSPWFGDLHVHTGLSLDANLQGNRLSPKDAYRFARGEEVGIQPHDAAGEPLRTLRIGRPLDFTAVTDHAEFLGLVRGCTTPASAEYASPVCEGYRDTPEDAFPLLNVHLALPQQDPYPPEVCAADGCGDSARAAWNETQDAAEWAYDRSEACAFTSFVGYEWSASPGTRNLHRNVIFRSHVVPELPTGYFDEGTEHGLWDRLHEHCLDAGSGCDVLTIPHNSNLSAGLMFDAPADAAYARVRAELEPLVEIFQHKGSSECRLGATAADELCDFEAMPYGTLLGANQGGAPEVVGETNFVRHALGRGLELGATVGENPFSYGIIASTDTHLGTPGAVDEFRFAGHGGAGLPITSALPPGLSDQPWLNPGGLAVLWAEENSREALFLAMRRREAYGTSGPRIVLRFFGGFGYDAATCDGADLAAAGYAGGVPMGGVLPAGSGAPRFVVSAFRDPGTEEHPGGLLERIQIVKGWLDGGMARYQTWDVAGGPLGSSVDPLTCEPDGLGAESLCAVWEDPTFDPTAPAFYYARVLEVPSCRWQQWACNQAGVDCADPGSVGPGFEGCCTATPTQQERAWSSPIWHAP